jgi:S1-C subfamily serine protease
MKRFISALLSLLLIFSLCLGVSADDGRFSHFLTLNQWTDGTFSDLSSDAWYYDSVVSAYRMGLINGSDDGRFDPSSNVTIAQALKMADGIHSLYTTATINFKEGTPWYQTYVDYALENRIITAEFDDYNAPATRAEFASIMARALPVEALPEINTVENGAIPDVPYSASYAGAVYRLYRAGIITGDSSGTFHPDSNISRAEAVAIVGRMTTESQRRSVLLTAGDKLALTGEEIFAKCSQAVFYIEMYDADGNKTANGSGFFIDSDGTAVTCCHVLERGVSAKILVGGEGQVYDVEGVYDYSAENDWAVIKINGSGFTYLELGDSKTNVGGATVYALGSPLGIQNTISQGLICNPTRIEDGTSFILFSAAISSGSSGGPIINKYGEAVGITAATYIYGQNLNLAINVSYLDGAARGGLTSLAQLNKILASE